MPRMSRASALLVVLLSACSGGKPDAASNGGSGGAPSPTASDASAVGVTNSSSGSSSTLDALLQQLDANRDATLAAESAAGGWPAKVEGGYLFVSTRLDRAKLAGAFTSWQPTAMQLADDFAWAVVEASAGAPYKFTDGDKDWAADPWSRSYGYDDHGEMSYVTGAPFPHLERYFGVEASGLLPRTLRVWLPASKPTRVLYVHDGQNLFDPDALWGGWKLADATPDGTMIVGIDNTAARMDEYTHVADDIGNGNVGGKADAYGAFLQNTVRPLIAAKYGEPKVRGVMGSSLGGLVSLAIADHYPDDYQFAASLSGTLGWGSIGDGIHHETMLARYQKHGHQKPVLYVDAGGGGPCEDADNDGVEDDGQGSDNFCENAQFTSALGTLGYKENQDLFTFHDPGAPHNEAVWAARVFRPLDIFAKLSAP